MAQPAYSELVLRVRDALSDAVDPPRWSDAQIAGALVDGLRLLHSIRPESRYVGLELQREDYPSITAATGEEELSAFLAAPCHVDPRWLDALRYHAAARCFEMDAADTANQARAEYCHAQFNALAKL